MAKNKSGLHKEISSIFDGVPIPKGRDENQTPGKPTPGRIGYVPAKMPEPPAQSQPAPKAPQPAHVPDKTQKTRAGKNVAIKTARPSAKPFAKKRGVSPARQKVMVAMIPVLLVALVAVLAYNSGMIPTRSAKVETPTTVNTAALAPSGFQIAWQMPPAYKAPGDDPMARSLGDIRQEVKKVAQLIVKGTVISEDTAYAIIDTEIVQVGQKVLGATVVAISPDSVEFERDGTKWTQQVHKPKDGR